MKTNILSTLLSIMIALTIFESCQCSEKNVEYAFENKEEARQDLKDAEKLYQAEMESFKTEVAAKVEANQAAVKGLRLKTKAAKDAAKNDFNQKLDSLEQQNNNLRKKVADLKFTDDAEWEKFKTELNRDIDGLGTAFSNLRTKNNK